MNKSNNSSVCCFLFFAFVLKINTNSCIDWCIDAQKIHSQFGIHWCWLLGSLIDRRSVSCRMILSIVHCHAFNCKKSKKSRPFLFHLQWIGVFGIIHNKKQKNIFFLLQLNVLPHICFCFSISILKCDIIYSIVILFIRFNS